MTNNAGRRQRSRSPLRTSWSSPQSSDRDGSDGSSRTVPGSEADAVQAEESDESGLSDSDDAAATACAAADRKRSGERRVAVEHVARLIAALADPTRRRDLSNSVVVEMPDHIAVHKPEVVIRPIRCSAASLGDLDAGKFDRADFPNEPERIVGATYAFGEIFFKIKWRDVAEADLVPSNVVMKKWPQALLNFYERHLTMFVFNMHII